jgi:ABC-2 type transport system ATP-binding protein
MRFTGDLYGIPSAQVDSDLESLSDLFGLHEHRRVLIKDLSHGLRQRLAYASTFLHHPKVLLVDEPFIGLDPHSIRLIRDLLRAKCRDGMTILLTTHILALAEDLADRIGIILDGQIIALGTLDELKERSAVGGGLEDIFLHLTES